MKIAIILPQLVKPGGAERVITYLANYWAKRQHEILIITFNSQPSIYYDLNLDIKLYSLFNKQATILPIINAISRILNLRKLLLIHQPNIAISVDIKANLALSIASIGIVNLISIATEHRHPPTVPMPKYLLKIVRLCYSNMHAVVALTQQSQAWFKKHTNFKHVALIANPLIYPLINTEPSVLPKTIIKSNKNTLLAVGRLHKQKGFDLLIPVFNQLLIKHNNWQLVILGEGTQRLELEQQINKLELQNKVYMPGAVGNVADWYEIVDVFVFPSRYEGFGCALTEAMAYNLPVVSFDCKSGPSDIITHEVNGLLVEDGNIDKFSKALDMLMSNKELRKQFAVKAIEVRKLFSIEKISNKWHNLFEELTN